MRCLKGENVLVSVGLNGQGLNGQDDNFDKLSLLWEQLQLSAYEPASQPEADLVSFAQSAPFFGLIAVRPATSKLTPSEPVAKKTVLDEHSLPEPHPTPSSLSKIDPFADICDFGHSPLKTESVSQNNNKMSEEGKPVTNNYVPVLPNGFLPAPHSPFRISPDSFEGMNVQPEDVIGLIYLTSSILSCPPPDQPRELNLGIIIIDRYRCKGYAREAVDLVLAEAFENHNVHRIQATLIDGSTKDRMTSILTQAWFSHEGTARSAFYHPLLAEWQDITRFGIIDTQWVMRRFWKPAPKTIWDELFMRHERERTELLRWEEMTGKVKRSTSMETLRAAPPPPDSVVDFTMSESESVSGDRDRDKGKAIDIEKWSQSVSLRRQERWMHGADSDADSVVADDHDAALAFDMAGSARLHRQPPSDSRSESGSVVSVPRSESVVSGPSSSDSWDDMMYDEESACEWENRSDED